MKARNENLLGRLQHLPPAATIVIGLLFLSVVGATDLNTPVAMTFTLFYLFGVVFVAWRAGAWPAIAMSAFATGLMVVVEVAAEKPRHAAWMVIWNASSRFLLLSLGGWLTARVSDLTRHLSRAVEERTAQWKAEAEQHKATSARLAEAIERFEQVINNITEVFWLSDVAKHEMDYISPGYERVWGRTWEEFIATRGPG